MPIKDKFCMNIHNLPINQQNIIITMAVLQLPNNKSDLMCYCLLKIVKFFSLNYFSTSQYQSH